MGGGIARDNHGVFWGAFVVNQGGSKIFMRKAYFNYDNIIGGK